MQNIYKHYTVAAQIPELKDFHHKEIKMCKTWIDNMYRLLLGVLKMKQVIDTNKPLRTCKINGPNLQPLTKDFSDFFDNTRTRKCRPII